MGIRFRRLREAKGETPAQTAAAIGMGRKTIDRIEKGTQGTKQPVIKALCDHFEVADQERSHIFSLFVRSGERGWWEAYFDTGSRESVNPDFPLFLESEQVATLIRTFEAEIIPGLLQVPEYLVELQAVQLPAPEEVAEQILGLRAHRQKLIFGDNHRPGIEFLLGEAAMVYLSKLPRKVRDGQIERMLEVDAMPNASIRVLTGLHAAVAGSFTLLTASPDLPPFVYLDSVDGCRYIEQPDVVSLYERTFEGARERSESIREYLK